MYFCGIRPSLIFLIEGRGVTFVTPVRVHRNCHISMYFLRKTASHFLPREEIRCFWGKIPSFQIIQERSCVGVILFGKTIFSESLKKIYFRVFFSERSSFIFRLRHKIIFSGKRNVIFPNNTKKINIFGNTGCLFRMSGKRKYCFPCSVD